MDWNYADTYSAIARAMPDAACQVQGDRVITWREFDRRSNALAHSFVEAGLTPGTKLAVMLHNSPEFLETYVACFKARLVPVNVNYRYGHDELVHVLGTSDSEAVVLHARYGDIIGEVRAELPAIGHLVTVDDGNPTPNWAVDYDDAVASHSPYALDLGRNGDDSLLLYTGGTTGLPKGVIWRQREAIEALGTAANFYIGRPPARSIDDVVSRLDPTGRRRLYVAPPMMHATGLFTSLSLMNSGYAVETTASERFDPAALWQVVSDHQVSALVIVGDTFARPLLAELDANAAAYDLSSLDFVISSGTKWSQSVRRGLLAHLPRVLLSDNYGSSEALRGVATNSTVDDIPEDGLIAQSNLLLMMDANGALLDTTVPGTRGALLIQGHLADGYYGDADKTAAAYITIDGQRYCVTGDLGRVEKAGRVRLLGRGSSVVNTGGEKVFPQEVETVIRMHPAVADVAVVGLPDERFGQAVTAVVVLHEGTELDLSTLATHVKEYLAGYKAPRKVFAVTAIPHTAAGKTDHKAARKVAQAMDTNLATA